MCCLFGIIDYKQNLTSKQLNKMIAVLSKACEARGTDATGIAYNYNDKLCIFKRPLPAHRIHYRIPEGVYHVMGHARMSTQGDERFNYNNHPFSSSDGTFALAHNGVIYNDEILKIRERLPETKIETDSYVAVQLIEKKKTISTYSLKFMAEQLEGSFTITVLDKSDNLYFIKGDNPMCIYHFKEKGIYIYASTEEILLKALSKMQMKLGKRKKVDIKCGEILTIDKYGNQSRSEFDTKNLDGFSFASYIWRSSIPRCETKPKIYSAYQEEYLKHLKTEAEYCGYSSSLIDTLLADGFSTDDIEEMIYCGVY
jgi:glucosamine 6-phosphate synthetase-like amidotransferase/phosphosugar isomerase protein